MVVMLVDNLRNWSRLGNTINYDIYWCLIFILNFDIMSTAKPPLVVIHPLVLLAVVDHYHRVTDKS